MNDEQIQFLKDLIARHVEPDKCKAYIFGSQAMGTATKKSDVDIGLEGDPLSSLQLAELEDDYEQSNFPFVVEFVQMSQTSDTFKQIAKQKIIPLN